MKAADIVKFEPVWWKMLGEELCERIRRRVQKQHTNASGQAFAAYSASYAAGKSAGTFWKKGKGTSQESYSTNPDMTFSGKTMASLQVRRHDANGVTIGWLALAADIVQSLAGHKNYRIINLEGNPLAKAENDFIMQSIEKQVGMKIEKYCQTPINITVTI